jgi:hypothetical protein
MTLDHLRYPELRASLEAVLEAVGYRLPAGITPNILVVNAVPCSPGGASKRLDGKIAMKPAEMSRLIDHATLARDGVVPEHFHDGVDALRRVLRERSVGLYGRSIGSRLHRAVRDFAGERGVLELRLGLPRSGGFVWGSAVEPTGPQLLSPDDPVHFACRGPEDCRLLLLDHAPDAGDPRLLVPALAGDWLSPRTGGWTLFPNPDDPVLKVRPDPSIRQVVALWLPEAGASVIDTAVPDVDLPFRPVPAPALETIIRSLGADGPGRARAATAVLYRAAIP